MRVIHANVFDGERFHADWQVRITDGAVTAAGKEIGETAGEEVLDLAGDTLLPGFVDVHIHGSAGKDAMRGEDDVRAMSRVLAEFGVAAFCPTTMSAGTEATKQALAGIRRVMETPERGGARVLGAHMEAPFLSERHAGAQAASFFCDPDAEILTDLAGGKPETVRLITLAPERKGSGDFIRWAAGQGIHVSIGHTDADAETVHRAAECGADHVTHLFNAQTPLHHRRPGVPGAALTDSRLVCEIICDGIHLHPDTVRLVIRAKEAGKAIAITDAMEAALMPDGEYALGGQRVTVRGGEARLADGTLAGSVLTMKQALYNLIHVFGADPALACAMCTSAPAASVGEKRCGRILPGAPGILSRWSPDWNWKGAVREGK